MQDIDEGAGAVGAGDLAVADHVALRDEAFLEEFDAGLVVGFGGVVAVGEVEAVDVPFGGGVVLVDEVGGALVGGGDSGAAVFADAEEGFLVDLGGGDVVDDEAGGDAVVVLAEPGVDPEGGEAHDFFLLVAHGAGDIHHRDDDGEIGRAHV